MSPSSWLPCSGAPPPPGRRNCAAPACGISSSASRSRRSPPRRRLPGWSDFARCPAEPSGLHEVYFEYDDEYEYIARARDLEREVARWAGTTEASFPVIVSALFG